MCIESSEILARVEAMRKTGKLSEMVTSAKIVYRASNRPGYIEQVNRETGECFIGNFKNGVFTPLDQDA